MVRSKYKDSDYFDRYIKYENSRIEKFKGILDDLISKENSNPEAIVRCKSYLFNFTKNKLMAIYSAGKSMEEVVRVYQDMMTWVMDEIIFTYRDLLEVSSLTVLLAENQTISQNVADLIEKSGLEDELLHFIKNYLIKGEGGNEISGFAFPQQQLPLSGVLWEEDKEKAKRNLFSYVNGFWYEANSDAAWYDTHKSEEDVFNGYWSLESAAISKIKGLDNYIFNKSEFFPIDMLNKS